MDNTTSFTSAAIIWLLDAMAQRALRGGEAFEVLTLEVLVSSSDHRAVKGNGGRWKLPNPAV